MHHTRQSVRAWLFPERWSRAEDAALLAFRILVGTFLIWGVWDNVMSAARMAEFTAFLETHGFVRPWLLAPLSVWIQLACGIGFLLGLLTRWAGVLCALNFLVALLMVDLQGGPRQAFPAAMLVLFGLYAAARGGGRYAFDTAALMLARSGGEQR